MKLLLATAILATFATLASAKGIEDEPIAADATQYLDGVDWTVTDSTGKVPTFGGSVPGDLLTDMQAAGVIGDPLYELVFRGNLWDISNYSYSTTFMVDPAVASAAQQRLVFDGIKMAADITLNGVSLGAVDNQFLRFSYDVSSMLVYGPTPNVLTVAFTTSKDARNLPGRWMACTGSWDWAVSRLAGLVSK